MAKLCQKATKYAIAITIIQLLILRPRPNAHRLGEEISYALLKAGLVVVVLLPGDQGERVQDLHDDLKEVGRRNLWWAERILSLTAKSSLPGIHQQRTR